MTVPGGDLTSGLGAAAVLPAVIGGGADLSCAAGHPLMFSLRVVLAQPTAAQCNTSNLATAGAPPLNSAP